MLGKGTPFDIQFKVNRASRCYVRSYPFLNIEIKISTDWFLLIMIIILPLISLHLTTQASVKFMHAHTTQNSLPGLFMEIHGVLSMKCRWHYDTSK